MFDHLSQQSINVMGVGVEQEDVRTWPRDFLGKRARELRDLRVEW